jgi:hypothetical protein
MRALILFFLFSIATDSQAKETTISTSPDGRYEVVVTAQADQLDIPFAQIRDKKTRKKFETNAMGYDGREEIEAIWRTDSHVVALNFSAGRTTHETLLYWVESGRITKITLPDFVLNILGRQGAIAAKFKNSAVLFVKFLPDNQCKLLAHVEPNPWDEAPNKARADTAFHPTGLTDFSVTLRLNNPFQTDLVAIEPDEERSAK